MIFQHTHEEVMSSKKTRTSRIIKKHQSLIQHPYQPEHCSVEYYDGVDYETYNLITVGSSPEQSGRELTAAEEGKHYTVYQVGKTYAVQPGRGKVAIGRIRITDIKREDVRDISDEDVKAEGFTSKTAFWGVWCRMHDKDTWDSQYELIRPDFVRKWIAHRPAECYQAWVLEFELVQA